MPKIWLKPKTSAAPPVSQKESPKAPDETMPSKPTRMAMRYGAKTVKKGG